jgi:uncharacterized protein (DUF924 family)
MDAALFDDVHRFWFGELSGPFDYPADKAPLWFQGGPDFDAEIDRRYRRYLKPAAAFAGDLAGLSRAQRVGLVVLLDQFPRNIFRSSGEAFAYDADARRHARAALALGPYHLVERVFLGLPFEHSESIADQLYAIELFDAMRHDAPPGQAETYKKNFDYAVKHRDLIARFGRFPHRNAVLGRVSTAEEEKFLAENGRGY